MPSIKLRYLPEEAKESFKIFTAFEQKSQFERLPIKILYGIAIVLTALGFIFQKQVLIYTGLTSVIILSFYLLFYVIKFKRYFTLICREIDKSTAFHNQEFLFSFDENGMTKKFPDFSNTSSWKVIQQYKVNEQYIYLYTNKNHLFDIISEKQIGEENYRLFLAILDKEFNSN